MLFDRVRACSSAVGYRDGENCKEDLEYMQMGENLGGGSVVNAREMRDRHVAPLYLPRSLRSSLQTFVTSL